MTADAHGQAPHDATEMVHAVLGVSALGELAEAIAARVVELLERPDRRPASGLATAAEVAEQLGVNKSWVYANQKRLGGIRLGDGPRARLRFDLERARRAVDKERSEQQRPRRSRGRPPKASVLPEAVELLGGRRADDRS
jgi:hypothetical protein